MSVSLILTSYSDLGQKKYSDCDSKNLEVVELTDDFFSGTVAGHVSDVDLWDSQEGPPYQQKALRACDIRQVVNECEMSAKDFMQEITKGNDSAKQRDLCFDRITMILNVRKLLKKKLTKYEGQDNIMVIVG